jgi:hypothetical protein
VQAISPAQDSAGRSQATLAATITGTISDPRGGVGGFTISARNLATDRPFLTTSAADGKYSLALPAGSYDVFLTKAGYATVTRRGLKIETGQRITIDASLSPSTNVDVPGEFTFLKEAAIVAGDAPRTPDGHIDLSGVWLPSLPIDSDDPPYLPWAAELQKKRANSQGDDPRANCLPSGIVRMSQVDLTKFVHTPKLLVILIEGQSINARQIFLDGRGHPAEMEPSWMGHSIGKWDGDTLVVDTAGFNDKGWIDGVGRPQTDKLHVIERFHRTGMGTMELEVTVDDPGAYQKPWRLRRLLKLAPEEELLEYVCNENNKPEHFVAK